MKKILTVIISTIILSGCTYQTSVLDMNTFTGIDKCSSEWSNAKNKIGSVGDIHSESSVLIQGTNNITNEPTTAIRQNHSDGSCTLTVKYS